MEKNNLNSEFNGILRFSGGLQTMRLRLVYSGSEIKGSIHFLKKDYTAYGRYESGVVTLYYFADDKVNTSQGTATLQVIEGGSALHGFFLYYSQNSNDIGHVKAELEAS